MKAFYSSVLSFFIESNSDKEALPKTHSSNINKEPVRGYCLTVGSNKTYKNLKSAIPNIKLKCIQVTSSEVDCYLRSKFKAFTL